MARRLKNPRQLELRLPTHGGKRDGAGRKPGPGLRRVSHKARPEHNANHPLHLVIRVQDDLPTLRSSKVVRRLRHSFDKAKERLGMRLVHWSIQRNHFHFVCEAEDKTALGRAMKGLGVRVARAVNELFARRGSVLADHYYARALRTPREVRNAVQYVLRNHALHALRAGRPLLRDEVDPFCSDRNEEKMPALTWLLSVGWRRARAPTDADLLRERGPA